MAIATKDKFPTKNPLFCLLQYTLLLLLILQISSCKKDSNATPATPVFVPDSVISGKVIDSIGVGIANVIVQDSTGNVQFTNNNGEFSFQLKYRGVVLTPIKDHYVFTPIKMYVNGQSKNVTFTGKSTLIDSLTTNEHQMLNWLNNAQLANGLIPSTDHGNQISLYDQALAALAFISYTDYTRAERIFDFFNGRITAELTAGKGGFCQFRDLNGNPTGNHWLGDNAWLLLALNNYVAVTGSTKYNNLIQQMNTWIRSLQDTDGGIWGGYDASNVQIGKITEGIMDAFIAVSGYDNFHSNLLSYLKAQRWDAVNKCFISWPGNTQYYYALDNFSWGFGIFPNCPASLLTQANMFRTTQTATGTGNSITGYCFDIDKDDVWLEGTGEMVVAYQIAGNNLQANYYLSQMEKAIINSTVGTSLIGIPYASNLATGYGGGMLWQGANTQPYLSSVSWYLFGKHQFDPFKAGRSKNIPTASMFWMN